MQADWEFEIGGDAPVIDASWNGFDDLREHPERARELPEACEFPALADVLRRLNTPDSPVWTSKCDFFSGLTAAEFDADELEASPGDALSAVGCYIDLLPANEEEWVDPRAAGAACERTCACLRSITLRGCRADFVIRRAIVKPERACLGITAYFTACGTDRGAALSILEAALNASADSMANTTFPGHPQ